MARQQWRREKTPPVNKIDQHKAQLALVCWAAASITIVEEADEFKKEQESAGAEKKEDYNDAGK